MKKKLFVVFAAVLCAGFVGNMGAMGQDPYQSPHPTRRSITTPPPLGRYSRIRPFLQKRKIDGTPPKNKKQKKYPCLSRVLFG